MTVTKVLVAEDAVASRLPVATLLEERLGLAVIRCSSASRAWDTLCDNGDLRLVVADLVLPGMEGGEFLQRLSASRKLRHIPVVVVMDAAPQREQFFLGLGAFGCVTRPVYAPLLREVVVAALARPWSPAPSGEGTSSRVQAARPGAVASTTGSRVARARSVGPDAFPTRADAGSGIHLRRALTARDLPQGTSFATPSPPLEDPRG